MGCHVFNLRQPSASALDTAALGTRPKQASRRRLATPVPEAISGRVMGLPVNLNGFQNIGDWTEHVGWYEQRHICEKGGQQF